MFANSLIIKILNYLDNNLYKKITINEISDVFHYNKDYIMRLFKRELGITVINYLNTKRIFNSLVEYKYSKISILNISLLYGFYSQEYYSEIFHQVIGVSPRKYYDFIHFNKSLSDHQIYTIQCSLAKIEFFMRKIDAYRLNITPKKAEKVLSIFNRETIK